MRKKALRTYLRARNNLAAWAQDEDGSLLEYALWGALIVVAVMAIVETLGGKIGDVFTSISNSL